MYCGMRHAVIAGAECEGCIVARHNANDATAESDGRTLPVAELIRLYAHYLHGSTALSLVTSPR